MAQQEKKNNFIDMSGPENDDPNPNRKRRASKVYDRPKGELCFKCHEGVMDHIQYNRQPGVKLCTRCAQWIKKDKFTYCLSEKCKLLLCSSCYHIMKDVRRKLATKAQKEVASESDPEEEAYLDKILSTKQENTKE